VWEEVLDGPAQEGPRFDEQVVVALLEEAEEKSALCAIGGGRHESGVVAERRTRTLQESTDSLLVRRPHGATV
jgi:hypothetical protein